MTTARTWTTFADVVAVLERRWRRGTYLRAFAGDDAWQPVVVPLTTPKVDELLDDISGVQTWMQRFERDVARRGTSIEVRSKVLHSRSVGENSVPSHVVVPTFDALCGLLGTVTEVATFVELRSITAEACPGLVPWMNEHPLAVVGLADEWTRLMLVVEWVRDNDATSFYIRQVDVAGVDTKFLERHAKALSEFLDNVLSHERIDASRPRADIARRYRFRAKPSYVRLRLGDAVISPLPKSVSEVTLRIDELDQLDFQVRRVFVVENEITYLAFPLPDDAIVAFGSGFALSSLGALSWLHDQPLHYWGDLDTHGFVMLDRLRQQFAHTHSFLMDETTLLDHVDHWSAEDAPTRRALTHLCADELDAYYGLVEGRHGVNVRLEQERVRFSIVEAAVQRISRDDPEHLGPPISQG